MLRGQEGTRSGESGWFRRGALAAGSGLLLVTTLAGCGDDDETSRLPESATPTTEAPRSTTTRAARGILACKKVPGQTWTPVAPNLNTDALAEVLDVSPESVASGTMGPVKCDEGATTDDITQGQTARVEGVPLMCQLVFIHSDQPPAPEAIYDSFGAVCPGVTSNSLPS